MAKAVESLAFERHGLSDEQLRWVLRNMHLQRTIDNRGFQLNRQGKIPFATGSEGHEGIHAGAALAFHRGKDILVPYYRDVGLCIGVGMDPFDVLLGMFARGAERQGGRQFPSHFTHHAIGIMSFSSIIAAHCPHAAGAAYSLKYRKESDGAVLCCFGEGATSEGEWHEAMNFSAVQNLPIVWLCENNEWAISTPRHHQMAIKDVIQKAVGYGMPGVLCDGSDPIAVYQTVKEALDRARTGGGPTLVEAKCYRFLSHTTDDDDRTYRTREEVELQRKLDPVPRFKRKLVSDGAITENSLKALEAEVTELVNRTTDEVETEPLPPAS